MKYICTKVSENFEYLTKKTLFLHAELQKIRFRFLLKISTLIIHRK